MKLPEGLKNNILYKYLSKGTRRTVTAKKNVVGSFLLKGVSILINFIYVPLCIDYLDKERYGIWLTVVSLTTWFSFLDIGFGAGLKNRLAEALALKDLVLARKYVSTTYAFLSIIIFFVAIGFYFVNPFISWDKILNTSLALPQELSVLSLIVFGSFFINFVIRIIENILVANQQTAFSSAVAPISNLISVIIIYILTKTTHGSLIYLGMVLGFSPIVVYLALTIYLFRTQFAHFAPRLRYVDFKYVKSLMSIGVRFFIIQISALVLFQTSNIIISHYLGPPEVIPYNLAYRYFSMLHFCFNIIIAPFWPAYTEAWTIKDIDWIRKTIKSLLKIWGVIFVAGLIMLACSNWFYGVWVHGKVKVPFTLSLLVMVYFFVFTFGGVYNMFINGAGKLKMQMISMLISTAIFFPLAYLFIRVLNLGVNGLIVAIIIANFYSPIIAPIQYYKLISGKAKGIWNK